MLNSSNELKKLSKLVGFMSKMLLELHKIRKVILQDGKEILSGFSIKPEHVPTFLKS